MMNTSGSRIKFAFSGKYLQNINARLFCDNRGREINQYFCDFDVKIIADCGEYLECRVDNATLFISKDVIAMIRIEDENPT